MFGAHWSAVSGHMTYLICHVTTQDHVTQELYDFIGSSPLKVTSATKR